MKSGTPMPTNDRAYFFSLLCRPGARKAQSWKSQKGLAMTTPATRETFRAMVKGATRPLKVMSAHGLPLSCVGDPSRQPTDSWTGLSRNSISSV